jgi:hypothetical protein
VCACGRPAGRQGPPHPCPEPPRLLRSRRHRLHRCIAAPLSRNPLPAGPAHAAQPIQQELGQAQGGGGGRPTAQQPGQQGAGARGGRQGQEGGGGGGLGGEHRPCRLAVHTGPTCIQAHQVFLSFAPTCPPAPLRMRRRFRT